MISESECEDSGCYTKKCECIKEYFLNDSLFNNNNKKIHNVNNILNKSFGEILYSFCNINKDHDIIMDYRYFKFLYNLNGFDKECIIQYIVNIVHEILKKKKTIVLHICFKSFTISDFDKYNAFFVQLFETMKNTFDDKLDKCFFYKAPFLFSQILAVLSMFFDKKILSKIQLVD